MLKAGGAAAPGDEFMHGDVPLYMQVAEYVREKIYAREWGVDEPIPSEHELMRMLGCARGTIQKGIRLLVGEGLLVQRRGRGTFVTQPVMARPSSNRLLSFGESMSSFGIEYQTEVISCRVEKASPDVIANLELREGSDYLYLTRRRLVRGKPVMFIESHLSLEACPGLEHADFSREALFAAVERTSGKGMGNSEMVYMARVVGTRRGYWLECDERAPVLVMDQLVRLEDGTPVEWGSVWLPANRCVIAANAVRA